MCETGKEIACEWWSSLHNDDKLYYINKYFTIKVGTDLTRSDKYEIYKKENYDKLG